MLVSVVLPIYLPSQEHKIMTDKCIIKAKSNTKIDCEWVIVETCSNYYEDEADVYIHEHTKTTPNISINNAFKETNGDFVIFLANDVFVSNGWVEAMLECFRKEEDCGIATLANNEHDKSTSDEILEEIYFSVCMFRKEDAWFDTGYDDLFDDTDLIMRIYSRGQKSYKNMKVMVEHLRHKTYGPPDLDKPNNIRQREYFRDKWVEYKDDEIYKRIA